MQISTEGQLSEGSGGFKESSDRHLRGTSVETTHVRKLNYSGLIVAQKKLFAKKGETYFLRTGLHIENKPIIALVIDMNSAITYVIQMKG